MKKTILLLMFFIFLLLLSCKRKENQIIDNTNIDFAKENETITENNIEYNIFNENIKENSSQSDNYADSNGTIIEIKVDGNITWVFRKHIQQIQIDYLAKDENLIIYDKPALENGNIVGRLKRDDYINISQVAETFVAGYYYYWVEINMNDDINGWIFCGKYDKENEFMLPYSNGNWEILDTIKINDKNWTVRKLNGMVTVWEDVLNMRDKPGVAAGTNVISKIIPTPQDEYGNSYIHLNYTAATEEEETIDGRTDRWLKITYNGIEGWIFGGYTSVERGGDKYWTPENTIFRRLGGY